MPKFRQIEVLVDPNNDTCLFREFPSTIAANLLNEMSGERNSTL
jgi:hypothetical protein